MRFAIGAALVAWTAFVVACSVAADAPASVPAEPSDTTGLGGQYRLTAIDGVPVPWIYSSNASSRTMLDSAHFHLASNHTFSDLRWQRLIALGSETPQVPVFVGTYAVSGDKVVLYYLGQDGLSLLRTDTALVNGHGGLTKVEGRASLMFTR